MMNRRRFLTVLGVTAAGQRALAGPAKSASGLFAGERATRKSKPYGSGHFGEWINDEHGLPAYRYTCNQLTDPKAKTPVNTVWRSPTDHTHQVGNDRLLAAVSNYGYVQVRQDEGSPKFLNDYLPEESLFGGGLGFLTDGRVCLSTYYPGNAAQFERIFGVGYFRKTLTEGSYVVDQVILAPFGDDPLLISQVTLVNNGKARADLRWVEYWGCQMYQFSYRALILAGLRMNLTKTAALRRELAKRFSHNFRALPGGAGLLETQRFLGRTPEDEKAWEMAMKFLTAHPNTFFGIPSTPPVEQAAFEDLAPPPTFLVSLDAPADGLATDGKAFFGAGGVLRPTGIEKPLDGNLTATGSESALLLERRLRLEPGKRQTLHFAYGYLPEGFEIEKVLGRAQKDLPLLWSSSSRNWKEDGLRLSVPSEPWVERELTWHHYYLRSNSTFDSFFREHILSQGHVYQYILGFQGAARDPLQHVEPFLFSRPQLVKEVLRYTLKEVQADGSIPYGIVGRGMIMPVIFRPSDLELWLLWLASEYVLATRDSAFLKEELPVYPVYGAAVGKESVGSLLRRCFRHLVDKTGTGSHGLLRLSNGDWNDNVVVGHVPPNQFAEVQRIAESVLNAAMACYVLDLYARMLTFGGDPQLAAEATQLAEAQRQAVRAQWAGRWFRRAWLTPELGWVGDEQLWLEPQPWAVIGGAASPDQAREVVGAIDELLRRPSPIGAMLMSKGLDKIGSKIGTGTNAGVWPSINGTLIWALAQVDGKLAWDEWKKNTLARHAEAYPDIWYGIWSGPDTYNSVLSKYPGQTMFEESLLTGEKPAQPNPLAGLGWTDWPVMNMHPHAWPLYSVAKLLGVEFREKGVLLAPTLPVESYAFRSPLLGLVKSRGRYEGWYEPLVAGEWTIELRLPASERQRFKRLRVNGAKQALTRTPDGAIEFRGTSSPGKPLRWVAL
ncbi:MAG: hypothetical protein LAO07_12620 [Acidobacteriia bacterium]|nr:hypothetical protein [Terriglobia bacterium]